MEKALIELIKTTPELMETAQACHSVELPNYYLAGGCITQLIWNSLSSAPPLFKVKDIDIVYFEPNKIKTDRQYSDKIQQKIHHDIPVDVKNQAYIHQWYWDKLGQSIPAHTSVEQGIASWLSAFSIGFRLNLSGEPEVYAAQGLDDAFTMQVKPNKAAMTEASYLKMTTSFKQRWPSISISPWN